MTTELHQLNHCLELDDQCPHQRHLTKRCLSSLVAAAGSNRTISDSDWLLVDPEVRSGMMLIWLRHMEEVLE